MFSAFDWKLFVPAALLVSIGSLVLSSVSPVSYPAHFFYILLAILAFFLANRVNFQFYKTFALWFYILSVVLLLATLVFGTLSRGARRWLEVAGFTLQTSEIVKPFTLLFVSRVLAEFGAFKKYFFAVLAGIIPFALIFLQPDLGSGIVVISGVLGAIFLAGISLRAIFILVIFLLSGLPFLWSFLESYQKERIFTFLQPGADPLGAGYNSVQAIIAIGSGGLAGRGLGQGTQSQLLFLPERHTDFIFASLGEELGLLGAGFVVFCFILLFSRLAALFLQSTDNFSRIFIGGTFFVIFVQTSVNIGMNLGILPITGIPLPFVSSGGSSLLAMSFTLGMISSCSRSLR